MPKPVHQVVINQKFSISANMQRVVLKGESIANFPDDCEGGYIKLLFPGGADKTLARSFTVRELDLERAEVAIDMVAHEDAAHGEKGPAAQWASNAEVGTSIDIQGPGACKRVNPDADWFLLAGDMSALPAICVNLACLPETATGYVLIEVIDEADKIDLKVPQGMEVHWVVNSTPETENSILEDKVMALPWKAGQAGVWVSGEFSASRALRQYFRHQQNVPKDFMYVSCYWKIGETDEGMKAAKKADSESW